MAGKTLCILGATGKTGKWALKGALVRGYSVNLVVRTPGKIEGLLQELFPDEDERNKFESKVESFISEGQEGLQKAFKGCAVVLSFVGMVKKGENVVYPIVMEVVAAMKSMTDGPKTFIFQSAIGTRSPDSQIHGKKALGCCLMCAIGCVPVLKSSFNDMSEAEDIIFEARDANPEFNLIPLRCAILEDKKGLLVDYKNSAKGYVLIKGDEVGPFAGGVDRQYVAQAALDLADGGSSQQKNSNLSCCNLKKEAGQIVDSS